MRILIVGGAGTVGTWLTDALGAEHQVTVLDRHAPGTATVPTSAPEESTPRVHHAEATDTSALAGAIADQDQVVHLAGVTPREGWADSADRIADAFAVNVGSLAATLEVCAEQGVRRVVHISSMAVFARLGTNPVDPEGEPDSFTPYGLSKRAGEWVARQYAEQRGLHVTSLRLVFPTADEDAPAWRHPGDHTLRRPALADGTPVPAVPASQVARAVLEAADGTGGHRTVVVSASRTGLTGTTE